MGIFSSCVATSRFLLNFNLIACSCYGTSCTGSFCYFTHFSTMVTTSYNLSHRFIMICCTKRNCQSKTSLLFIYRQWFCSVLHLFVCTVFESRSYHLNNYIGYSVFDLNDCFSVYFICIFAKFTKYKIFIANSIIHAHWYTCQYNVSGSRFKCLSFSDLNDLMNNIITFSGRYIWGLSFFSHMKNICIPASIFGLIKLL